MPKGETEGKGPIDFVFVRNENYYGDKPTVAQITWKIVPEAATREAMLRTGQVHMCYKPLPSNLAALQTDSGIKVEMPLDTRTIFMGLNCQKGVTVDKKVRQAFNYAVDKKAIVKKILFDTAEPMDGPVSPVVFGYHKMDQQYDYNPEKAKKLLKEANFDFSKTVSMRTPQGRYLFDKQVSEAVQAYLQAIGVKAELRTYDWPTYIAGLQKPLAESELEVFLPGIPAGIISAVRPYSWVDYVVTMGALFGISMPVFWLGLMLVVVFSVILRWLPAGGASG